MPLGPYLDAVAAARRFCDRTAAAWGLCCPTLAGVVDELVAAAINQSSGHLDLTLERLVDGVRVRVRLRKAPNAPDQPTLSLLAGRIVMAQARTWGTGASGSDELFWAEVALTR